MHPRLTLIAILMFSAALACNLGRPIETPTTLPTYTVAAISTAVAQASITPLNTAVQPTPGCTPRSDWPVMTVASGDTLYSIAQRIGSTVDDLVAANCLTNASSIYVGQALRVPVVLPPVTQNCSGSWFFTFSAGRQDSHCPGQLISTNAVGENFEGGRAYWYQAQPGASDPRGTIYIIYNDGSWETVVDTFTDGQMESDPNIVPPAGRFQPVRGIGKAWREVPGVRSRLGWAYERESPFAGRVQFPLGDVGSPAYWYIDHGWRRLVLKLYSVDMGPNRWEVAGSY